LRPAPSLSIALLAAVAATAMADTAMAQTPGSAASLGLRQLTWSGRSESLATPPATSAARSELRRPNLVIPHGGFASVEPTVPRAAPATAPRRTLTPANAWLQPAAPVPPAPVPPAIAVEPAAPAPVRFAPTPVRPMPARAPAPDYLPDQGGRGQPVPAGIAYAPPSEPAPPSAMARSDEGRTDPADPMAPRRDAPIFRLAQAMPRPEPVAAISDAPPRANPAAPRVRRVAEVTSTGERPPQQGARYYSVHRQNGRQPDPLTMPEPTYVDALAITMTETPASQDLAQPDQGPTLIRDNQGRVRPAPAASDGDHQ